MNPAQAEVPPAHDGWTRRTTALFWIGVIATTILAAAVVVFAGRRLLISGHLWPPDLLFGLDTARGIDTISKIGYHERDNVHPYFYLMVQPLGRLLMSTGITPGMAAVILNAAAGALGLILTGYYFRLRRVKPLDAWLGVLLMASTATWQIESALPDSFMFSMAGFVLLHILLARTIDASPAVDTWLSRMQWLILGLLLYGITVTNGMMAFIARGFATEYGTARRAWARAVGYGAAVLTGGLLVSFLCGSSLDLWLERRWISDPAFHGADLEFPFLQSLWTFIGWSIIAPDPALVPTLDDRGMYFIGSLSQWKFTAFGIILTFVWIAVWLAACIAAARDKRPRERALNQALACSLAFNVLLHTFYHISYEGMFLYSGHTLFFVIGFLASLLSASGNWSVRRRTVFRAGLALFGIAMAIRHAALLLELGKIIPLPQ